MTAHDPLCPCYYKDTQMLPRWEERCQCDLIAKADARARADERKKAAQRVEQANLITSRPDGFLVYLDDAVAAARGES